MSVIHNKPFYLCLIVTSHILGCYVMVSSTWCSHGCQNLHDVDWYVVSRVYFCGYRAYLMLHTVYWAISLNNERFPFRQMFELGISTAEKSILNLVKLWSLVAIVWFTVMWSLRILYTFVFYARKSIVIQISKSDYTSQGYIFHILRYFATELRHY